MLVVGVLILVVVDHGQGDGDGLPCLLYQMPPGPLCHSCGVAFLCGLEIFCYTVCGGELALMLAPKWLLVLSSGTMHGSGKQGCVKSQGTVRRCIFSCPI